MLGDFFRKLVGRARSLYSEAMQKNSNEKSKDDGV